MENKALEPKFTEIVLLFYPIKPFTKRFETDFTLSVKILQLRQKRNN